MVTSVIDKDSKQRTQKADKHTLVFLVDQLHSIRLLCLSGTARDETLDQVCEDIISLYREGSEDV